MESASLADYSARLVILRSVGVLASWCDVPDWLSQVLANLHWYYAGHAVTVVAALDDRLKTAEEKVKEYVKMAKWKDTSFWSVRTIVEKTRKMFHKTLREYEKSISVGSRQFLVESKAT